MKNSRYNPDLHHRRSIRLRNWDYFTVGAYFATICTQDCQHVFGEVVEGEVRLKDAGRMELSAWEALPHRFLTIGLDAFVIMPNHVREIIVITQIPVGAGLVPAHATATTEVTTRVAPTVGDVVGAFKSITLERIREYILNNPANWATDEDNVAVFPAFGRQEGG